MRSNKQPLKKNLVKNKCISHSRKVHTLAPGNHWAVQHARLCISTASMVAKAGEEKSESSIGD